MGEDKLWSPFKNWENLRNSQRVHRKTEQKWKETDKIRNYCVALSTLLDIWVFNQ